MNACLCPANKKYKNMSKKILTNALISAGVTVAYIIIIASFLSRAEKIFGQVEPKDTTLIPIVMLLLFVISAGVTGFAVVGRPVMWYIDGKKKEAVKLLGATLSILALIAIFFILILL